MPPDPKQPDHPHAQALCRLTFPEEPVNIDYHYQMQGGCSFCALGGAGGFLSASGVSCDMIVPEGSG
jgi:hypothetical protein